VHAPRKLRVVHNPVDTERFRPGFLAARDARSRLGLPEGVPVLGVVAQITPWKGQYEAVATAAQLREQHRDVRLVLVGSPKFTSDATRFDNPDYARRLEHSIDELDLRENVLLLGERTDVPEIMSALDILLVPSWYEPFGRTMIEAMAMGLPVIATSVGGPREVIRDGESGFLLPPKTPARWARQAAELLADADRRARIGAAARERVLAEFSTRAYVERVLSGYREALAEG
jgi:glycosyltransferase involved in cell wall biosynthesis